MTSGRLAGKVCIITGTGGGMGRVAALMFAREGATVVGCDVNEAAEAETLRQVQAAGGAYESMLLDLSQAQGAQQLAAQVGERHGRIDVLYNNGGAAQMAWLPDMTPEQWKFTLRHELDIVFFACQAVWPWMIKAGGGSIINVGSVSGKLGYEVLPAVAHSAAKGGVIAMTKHLAMEGGPHRIRANSISPGLVLTSGTRRRMEDPQWAGPMLAKIMLGRAGEAEDIIPAAIYLASDESSWVTGSDLAIDGGTTAW